MVNFPLLSIVVSVYNAENLISSCIEAIPYTQKDSVELIIKDGCSTDLTVPIATSACSRLSIKTKVISIPDNGIYQAWNQAVDIATGIWICFIGADDRFISPIDLSLLENSIEKYNYLTFQGLYKGRHYGRSLDMPITIASFAKGWRIMHQGSVYKKDLLETHKFNESFRICGDFEHLIRVHRLLKYKHVSSNLLEVGSEGVSSIYFNTVANEALKSFLIQKPLSLKIIIFGIFLYARILLFSALKNES
jgi:glycosyltransferase involved in cell wall biosynthesis